MKLNRLAVAAAAMAAAAVISGCGVTHPGAVPAANSKSHAASAPVTVARPAPAVDPSVTWLVSPGGQAQVTFNDAVAALAGDLEVESHSPTVANHLVFEADARVVRAQARNILATPALLPTVNREAYKRMLNGFITVANLLQPGPGYGTTPEDYAAWYAALRASNIMVS